MTSGSSPIWMAVTVMRVTSRRGCSVKACQQLLNSKLGGCYDDVNSC
jgi:hypothetical protein